MNNRYDSHLRSTYGITLDEYKKMLMRQRERCLICRQIPRPSITRKHCVTLVVDHDHATNRIRGLLCPGCNTGLGAFKESAVLLRRAIGYITSQTMDERIHLSKGSLVKAYGAWHVRWRQKVRQKDGSIKLVNRSRRLAALSSCDETEAKRLKEQFIEDLPVVDSSNDPETKFEKEVKAFKKERTEHGAVEGELLESFDCIT